MAAVSALPQRVDLVFYQGDDVYMTVRVTDPDTGLPVDLTGYTFRSQIRSTVDSDEILAEFDITLGVSVGEIFAHLPAASTGVLEAPSKGVWDFEITDAAGSGRVSTVCGGSAVVSPEVTR